MAPRCAQTQQSPVRIIRAGALNSCCFMVPKRGLEPSHPCEYMDLNHARLPIPPHPHVGGKFLFYTTSTPMLRAVPATCRLTASRSKELRSGILILAISSICASVILPTLVLCGSGEPFARFTARLMSTGTGGVLVMNVNERSEKIVITTGMISPSWSLLDVLALNALQKSMMLTPCGPSAVPTGGAGVAFPAGICNFT